MNGMSTAIKAFVFTFPYLLSLYVGGVMAVVVPPPFGLLAPEGWRLFMFMMAPSTTWLGLCVLYAIGIWRFDDLYIHIAAAFQWVALIAGFFWLRDIDGQIAMAFAAPGSMGFFVRCWTALAAIFDGYMLITLLVTILVTAVSVAFKSLDPGFIRVEVRREINLALYGTTWRPSRVKNHGDASIAKTTDLAKEYSKGDFIFGVALPPPAEDTTPVSKYIRKMVLKSTGLTDEFAKAPLLRGSFDGHILICSGAGGGKTVTVVIPNAVKWDGGSLVCIDPKGEVAAVTRGAREKRGHRVFCLRMEGGWTDSMNVLGWIDPSNSSNFLTDVASVASWLMPDDAKGDGGAAYYNERGRTLITVTLAIVLLAWHIKRQDDPMLPRPTLLDVYDLLFRSPAVIAAWVEQMSKDIEESPDCYGPCTKGVKRWLDTFIGQDMEKTFPNLTSSCQKAIWWLGVDAVADMVTGNAKADAEREGQVFDATDIIDGKTSIYVNLPLKTLTSMPGVARLIVGSFLNGIINSNPSQRRGTTLFLIDEMQALGNFDILHKTALSQGRGYGISLCGIIQSPHGLKAQAGETAAQEWEDNAVLQLYFAIGGTDTAEKVSKALGTTTVEEVSYNKGMSTSGNPNQITSGGGGNSGVSVSRHQRSVRSASEVMQTDRSFAYALVRIGKGKAGKKPMLIGTAFYENRPEIVAECAPNPFKRQKLGENTMYLPDWLAREAQGGRSMVEKVLDALNGGSAASGDNASPEDDDGGSGSGPGDAPDIEAGLDDLEDVAAQSYSEADYEGFEAAACQNVVEELGVHGGIDYSGVDDPGLDLLDIGSTDEQPDPEAAQEYLASVIPADLPFEDEASGATGEGAAEDAADVPDYEAFDRAAREGDGLTEDGDGRIDGLVVATLGGSDEEGEDDSAEGIDIAPVLSAAPRKPELATVDEADFSGFDIPATPVRPGADFSTLTRRLSEQRDDMGPDPRRVRSARRHGRRVEAGLALHAVASIDGIDALLRRRQEMDARDLQQAE